MRSFAGGCDPLACFPTGHRKSLIYQLAVDAANELAVIDGNSSLTTNTFSFGCGVAIADLDMRSSVFFSELRQPATVF